MTAQSGARSRNKAILGSILSGMIIGFLAAAVLYKAAPDWTPDFLESSPVVFFGFFTLVCGVLGWIHAIVPDSQDRSGPVSRNPWLSSILSGALIGFLAAAALYGNLPPWIPAIFRESPWMFFGVMILLCAGAGYLYMKGEEYSQHS